MAVKSKPYVVFRDDVKAAHLTVAAQKLFPGGFVNIRYNTRYVVLTPVNSSAYGVRIRDRVNEGTFACTELINTLRIPDKTRYPLKKVAGSNSYCFSLKEGEPNDKSHTLRSHKA